MNLQFLGDSYDLVKRFFVGALRELGYEVVADPMFTDVWATPATYYQLIGALDRQVGSNLAIKAALLLDPDTGIREKPSKQHVSFQRIADATRRYRLVCSFDQSFARGKDVSQAIQTKLKIFHDLGLVAMYYDSHARFLFASREQPLVDELRQHLRGVGIPTSRLLLNGEF